MSDLSKKEIAALAMHELMKRDQQRLRDRVHEQNRISTLPSEKLEDLVKGFPLEKEADDDRP